MLGTMANHGFLEDIEATSATEIVKLQLCNSELLRPISVYSFRTMDCERGTCWKREVNNQTGTKKKVRTSWDFGRHRVNREEKWICFWMRSEGDLPWMTYLFKEMSKSLETCRFKSYVWNDSLKEHSEYLWRKNCSSHCVCWLVGFLSFGLLPLPFLKLTARTWKWMVGRRPFPFGARPVFRGELLALGSVSFYCVRILQCFKVEISGKRFPPPLKSPKNNAWTFCGSPSGRYATFMEWLGNQAFEDIGCQLRPAGNLSSINPMWCMIVWIVCPLPSSSHHPGKLHKLPRFFLTNRG